MALVDCIIKFGGSALTIKSQFETLNQKCLQESAMMIHEVLNDFLRQHGRVMRLIVIHGAGSFGHFQAKQYHLTEGHFVTLNLKNTIDGVTHFEIDSTQLCSEMAEGISKTRRSVLTLHQHFLGALIQQGVNAVGISPFGSWETHTTYDPVTNSRRSTVVRHNVNDILKVVQSGLVPVLHGDCVFDTNNQQRVNILSGDSIVHILAKEFSCVNVIFASDVKGIYTAPPESENNAQLIPEILLDPLSTSLSNLSSFGSLRFSQHSVDVTGGILGKIDSAIRILRDIPNARVIFCKAGSFECHHACLGNDVKECTVMKVAEKK